MAETFNMFDLIFIFATLIFVFIAFLRGFVREVFALLNWIISILLCYALAPYATKFVGSYTDNILISNVVSSALVFMLIFIFMAVSTNKWAHALQEKMPQSLDKGFGVLFGVVKSLIIFGIVYSLTVNFYSMLMGSSAKVVKSESKVTIKDGLVKSEKKITVKDSHRMPDWLADAKCLPLTRIFGTMLDPMVRHTIKNVETGFNENNIKAKSLDEKIEEVNEKVDEVNEEIDNNEIIINKKVGEKYHEKGYSKKEIEKMNRLIEIVE